ncbi:MAG: hypothetical protein JXR88_05205 [Clostridia bacterium]|nr:hypothetical protein [Clostridia bacterium]
MQKEEQTKWSPKQKKIIKYGLNGLLIVVLIAAWIWIVKVGITKGKSYIDDALVKIEMQNIENHQNLVAENEALNREIDRLNEELNEMSDKVVDLNESINTFSLDVNALASSIEFIETGLENSIVMQSEIGNKIQELDNRLKELKNSLNILLEAPK